MRPLEQSPDPASHALHAYIAPSAGPAGGPFASDDEPEDLRLGMLVRALEHEVIPRLMVVHRGAAVDCLEAPELPGRSIRQEDVERFVRLVLAPDQDIALGCIHSLRDRGIGAETLYLHLLAPVARRLGALWEQDLCDFTDVTIGLARLHHLLHEISATAVHEPSWEAGGRRILLAPAPGEQHTFGLVMTGEFFRRAGWDTQTTLAQPGADVAERVARGWFDVVGYTLSAQVHLPALRHAIRAARAASVNPRLCIIVGGALFTHDPGQAPQVGADAAASSASEAPVLAARLVADVALVRPAA